MLRVTPDGKRIKLFYNSPLPASARVRVTVDGASIIDGFGNALDADGDGVPGGVATFDFDTCSTARIPNTNVFGHVFASEQQGPGGENVPIGGVTIRADGMPDLFAVTDENGFFQLENTPAPLFTLTAPQPHPSAAARYPPADSIPTSASLFIAARDTPSRSAWTTNRLTSSCPSSPTTAW